MSTELVQAFNELQKENTDIVKRAFNRYENGYITAGELQSKLCDVFNAYCHFLPGNGVHCHITEDNWQDVLHDYEQWRRGAAPDRKSENPWLISGVGLNSACAAPEVEKALFFTIIEFLKLPISFYQPIPNHIAVPQLRRRFYNGGEVWDVSGIVKDGGLLDEPVPIGKTFVLTDKYGLKTRIQIYQTDPCANSFDTMTEYRGTGTIEGYTASTPVEITISLDQNKKISSLNMYMYHGAMLEEHRKAHSEFPLWREYFKECDKWNAALSGYRTEFFRQYCDQSMEPVLSSIL